MDAGLLPIKSPLRAKRRLAEVLEPGAHGALVEALLEDALDFAVATQNIRWFVVSDAESVRERAADLRLGVVADDGRGLNQALKKGLESLREMGAESVTVIPGDVPLARPEDAQDVLDTGAVSDVVVVPATDGGTNGLFFKLPTEMAPRFGPESLRTHVEEAERLGLRCSILDIPRLAIDLDTPDDATALHKSGESGGRTLEVLARLLG